MRKNPENLITIPATMEVSYLFEALTDHIEATEDTLTILTMAQFLSQEINAWEGTKSDEANIIEAVRLLKEIR